MSENGYASIEDLRAATNKPRREREVLLPVSGLKVRIQEMTERERSELETEGYSRDGGKQIRQRMADLGLRIAQRCLIEPRVQRQHIELLKEFNCTDMNVLKEACADLCGFSAADMESLEGNSETATAHA